jgi:hypothetical protein
MSRRVGTNKDEKVAYIVVLLYYPSSKLKRRITRSLLKLYIRPSRKLSSILTPHILTAPPPRSLSQCMHFPTYLALN